MNSDLRDQTWLDGAACVFSRSVGAAIRRATAGAASRWTHVVNGPFVDAAPGRFLSALAAVMVACCTPAVVFCQARPAQFEIHNRGEVWQTVKDDGTLGAPNPTNRFDFTPSLDWPGGPATLTSKDDQRSYIAGAGMWIGGRRQSGQLFFTENGPFTFVDQGTFDPIVKTTNYSGSSGFDWTQPEETITASWTTTQGIRVARTSRAWSYREYRTAIFYDYALTNTNSETLTDVFVGFPYLLRPSYQDFVVHNGWGDDFNRTDELVGYDSTLQLLYAYDDTPNFSIPGDVGNYWAAANELRTTGYAGVALLSADAASDARPQPSNVLVIQILSNERFLSIVSNTVDNMYAILSGADRTLEAAPDQRLTPLALMACGPYSMPPGATIRIALVEAVNGLPISAALIGSGNTLETAQGRLPRGLDSLRATVRRARGLFALNYTPVSVPPPSPFIEIIPLPTTKSISITWPPLEGVYTNPVTGRRDIRGYRVYRADRAFTGPFNNLIPVFNEIKVGFQLDRQRYFNTEAGKWRYVDQSITVGTGYYYAITTIDSSGNESWLTNRNTTAVRAVAPAAPNALNVRVFPNPFKEVSGFPTSGEEKTIVFTNLPGRCTIRIYTVSGELIKTIRHEAVTSGSATWNQLTDARQRTASGMYFWTVESEVGSARGTLILMK